MGGLVKEHGPGNFAGATIAEKRNRGSRNKPVIWRAANRENKRWEPGESGSRWLKGSREAQGITSRRGNGVAGKKAGEIDEVEAIVQILDVALKAQ